MSKIAFTSRPLILILSLALSFSLSLGCSAVRSPQPRSLAGDIIDQSYWLIDQGRAEEAVAQLSELDLSHYEVRMALATAHMSLAGIRVADYLKVIRALTFTLPPEQDQRQQLRNLFARLIRSSSPEHAQDLQQLENFFITVFDAVDLFYRFYSIPSLTAEQAQELKKAQRVLRRSSQPEPAESLLHSMISIILLKYNLTENNYFPRDICQAQAQDYLEGLEDLVEDLRQVIVLLAEGLPQSRDKLQSFLVKLDQQIPDIQQSALWLESQSGINWIDFEKVLRALMDLLIEQEMERRSC